VIHCDVAGNAVGVRELRNHGGSVLERVQAGEEIVVTKSGRPVAVLKPLKPAALEKVALLARWRALPTLDLGGLREDLDRVLDAAL